MQEIFTSASGDGNDALIVQLGVAGMTDLLHLYFPDHLITAEDIGGVFVALSLDAACSFTYSQFESFVNHLFLFWKADIDCGGGDANAKAQVLLYVPRVSPDVGGPASEKRARLELLKRTSCK